MTQKGILIADDHTLFRETLQEYLKRADKSYVIFSAKDMREAADVMEKNSSRIGLVILDLYMPEMDGMAGLEKFIKRWPETPVAIMSGVAQEPEVEESLDKGACGFFPKTLGGKALVNAIELVLSGERYVPADFVPPPRRSGSRSPSASDVQLTRRETEVLRFLLKGASNKDIAREMGLQTVTVKLHIRGIFRKLSAKNRTQAVIRAQELGLDRDEN